MVKKAVLIGCNYPGTPEQLNGCCNDVQRFYAVLIDRFGFEPENIQVLIDNIEGFTLPTGANIRKALANLVDGVEPGDVLVVQYSGHGTRVPPETGEDDDTGYDECIYPADGNLLTDDDFREVVNKVPEGASITIVSDSCHSGGLIDHGLEQIGNSSDTNEEAAAAREVEEGYEEEEKEEEEEEDTPAPVEEPEGTKGKAVSSERLLEILSERRGEAVDFGNIRTSLYDTYGEDASAKVKVFVNATARRVQSGDYEVRSLAEQFLRQKLDDQGEDYLRVADREPYSAYAGSKPSEEEQVSPDMGILISGCESFQTSADAMPTGDPAEAYGVLTNSILQVLAETEGNITNRDLVRRVRQIIQKAGYTQRPCLYCSDENAEAYFICEI